METVAGIFSSRRDAEEAIRQLHSLGLSNDRLALLTPGTPEEKIEHDVPTTDAESPGMGQALGGTVGGAMGVAGGATLGAAAASLIVPGVGPVIAGGLLGAALLGAGGTVTGVAAGAALEEALEEGLPRDELYVYEDALRRGKSVVVVFVDEDERLYQARKVFTSAGAESIDDAREQWWVGLRDGEAAHYSGDFTADEPEYRRGFQSALCVRENASSPSDQMNAARAEHGEAFLRGHERGDKYQKDLRERYRS